MRVLVLDNDPESRGLLFSRLEEALRQAEIRRAELVEGNFESLGRLIAQEPPHIAFLGPGCYQQLEDSLARFRAVFPRVPVALVLGNEIYAAEAVELRRILSVRIMPVADIAQMAQFILDCDGPSATGVHRSRGVISVMQLKGGVGASTIAAALAACWARNDMSVALVDFDDLNPHLTSWANVPTPMRKATAAMLKSGDVPRYRTRELVHQHPSYGGQLGVVGQPESYSDAFHMKADVIEGAASSAVYVNSVLSALKDEFDVVVVDAGRSWGVGTFSLLPESERVVMIVDNDPLSLDRTLANFMRLYRESDDAAEFDLAKWSFVLNRFASTGVQLKDVVDAVENLELFPETVDLFPVPYVASAAHWSATDSTLFELADESAQGILRDLAYSLVPFQFNATAAPLYDRLRRSMSRLIGG